MKTLLHNIAAAITICIAVSCTKTFPDRAYSESPVTVSFFLGDGNTRTSIAGATGDSTVWNNGDAIALWAKASDGSYALSGQKFTVYGFDGNRAVFTAALASAMTADTYLYAACHPYPNSVSGTVATFNLPSSQDGKAGNGADIMAGGPVEHGELKPTDIVEDYSRLRMRMKHLVHLLKFYMPSASGGLNGEPIQKISVSVPGYIAGTVSADIADESPVLALEGGGSSTIDIIPDSPLEYSDDTRKYAVASVVPFTAAETDKIRLKMVSDNYLGTKEIPMGGREFKAGHSTPVSLAPDEVNEYYKFNFVLADNHLGENIQKVTFTAPDGTSLGDGEGNAVIWEPGREIVPGDSFSLRFEELSSLQALSGKEITCTYESEHAKCSEKITLPSSIPDICFTNITVPYLFYEDFSETTQSNEYNSNSRTNVTNADGSEAIDLAARNWPAGWTGARCGISAGNMVRVCCRGESVKVVFTFAGNYNGKLDSPTMSALKSDAPGVKLRIQFDYSFGWYGSKSSNKQHYLVVGVHNESGPVDAAGGLNYVGKSISDSYVIREDIFDSSIKCDNNDMYLNDLNSHFDATTSQLCTNESRFEWEVYMKDKSNDGYYNYWVFLDNIKVSIAN